MLQIKHFSSAPTASEWQKSTQILTEMKIPAWRPGQAEMVLHFLCVVAVSASSAQLIPERGAGVSPEERLNPLWMKSIDCRRADIQQQPPFRDSFIDSVIVSCLGTLNKTDLCMILFWSVCRRWMTTAFDVTPTLSLMCREQKLALRWFMKRQRSRLTSVVDRI